MSEEIKEILEGLPFWEHLEKEERELLERESRKVFYPAGASVYSGARECLGEIFIQKGKIGRAHV